MTRKMNAKRAKIEKLIYETMDLLDKRGVNSNFYKTLFGNMTDTQFDAYMKDFLQDDSQNFYLEVEPFKPGGEPSMQDIENAADHLGVPLTENMWMPYINRDGEPIRTIAPVPVGYIHIKRLQQLLSKKNTMSTSIAQRDAKFNQVTSADKSGRVSDSENYALVAINADLAMREFMGARADDSVKKQQMLKDIATFGTTSLKDMPDDIENKVSLNLLDVYFTGCHIQTDLITPGLQTIYTQNMKKAKDLQQEKYKK